MKYDRFSLIATLSFLYFLPLFLFSLYGLFLNGADQKNWTVFSIGLFIGLCGTGILFLMVSQWEISLKDHYKKTEPSLPQVDLSTKINSEASFEADLEKTAILERQEKDRKLSELEEQLKKLQMTENDLRSECKRLLEKISQKDLEFENLQQYAEQYRIESEGVVQGLALCKSTSGEQLEQRDETIRNMQNIVLQQKISIETLQQQVLVLQSKEEELNYEIKTLLYVSRIDSIERDPTYQLYASSSVVGDIEEPLREKELLVDEYEDANADDDSHNDGVVEEEEEEGKKEINLEMAVDHPVAVLRECLEMASKMNGLGSARPSNLPPENYVLDMRRLCDNLRIETKHIVLLYSQKNSKVVFANSQVKDLLGWSPDKFTQIFPEIIQSGFTTWREGLQALGGGTQTEISLKVPMKPKEGVPVLLNCHLGFIESGIFRNHVIAVLNS